MDIEQRYSDAPSARLRVLTAPAFGAAKLIAWLDRGTSRDLYDLYAMAEHGLVTKASFELFAEHSSFTRLPGEWAWSKLPTAQQWRSELGHQLRLTTGPQEAAATAQSAWAAASG